MRVSEALATRSPATTSAVAIVAALAFAAATVAKAEHPLVAAGHCKPVSERKTEVGCWILSDDPVGVLAGPQTFWHLDVYPTQAAAKLARTNRGTVLRAFGKVWLLTIERAQWHAAGGRHIATIGPLPVKAGVAY